MRFWNEIDASDLSIMARAAFAYVAEEASARLAEKLARASSPSESETATQGNAAETNVAANNASQGSPAQGTSFRETRAQEQEEHLNTMDQLEANYQKRMRCVAEDQTLRPITIRPSGLVATPEIIARELDGGPFQDRAVAAIRLMLERDVGIGQYGDRLSEGRPNSEYL